MHVYERVAKFEEIGASVSVRTWVIEESEEV